MKTETVTNILCSVYRPNTRFTERFVLPQYRGEMDRLYDESVKRERMLHTPIMTCLDDKIWCNDDSVFMLERMLNGIKEYESQYKLLELTDEYLYRPWGYDEIGRVLSICDGMITFCPDYSDLSHLNLINVETNELIKMEN